MLSTKAHIATPRNGRSQPRPSSAESETGRPQLSLARGDDREAPTVAAAYGTR